MPFFAERGNEGLRLRERQKNTCATLVRSFSPFGPEISANFVISRKKARREREALSLSLP